MSKPLVVAQRNTQRGILLDYLRRDKRLPAERIPLGLGSSVKTNPRLGKSRRQLVLAALDTLEHRSNGALARWEWPLPHGFK